MKVFIVSILYLQANREQKIKEIIPFIYVQLEHTNFSFKDTLF